MLSLSSNLNKKSKSFGPYKWQWLEGKKIDLAVLECTYGFNGDNRTNNHMSLETVFAAIGGYLILNEILGGRELAGCGLMLAGMVLSQYKNLRY